MLETRVLLAVAALAGPSLLLASGAPAVPQEPVQVLVEAARAPAAARDAIRDSGGRPQTSAHGVVEALVPRSSLDELRADPSVETVSVAPVASQDAVTSAGVARIGADAYRNTGATGAGVKIVILDQAFGDLSRLSTL